MDFAIAAPRVLLLLVFLVPSLYLHFRGNVRLKLLRQLGNHSTLLAPYNALMYLFSAVPVRPVLDPRAFPELSQLRDNWREIREEALRLYEAGHIQSATGHNDLGFNSFFKRGWKRFYLKWYGEPLPSALRLCPHTVELVQSLKSVNAAMFAVLQPGAKLNPHRDPFAGSLRYHLGLITPNSDACRMYVDGQFCTWRDGTDVLFDETYVHTVENATDQYRVILFCDVERPLRSRVMTAINRFVSRYVMRAAATQNVETEHVGLINRIYTPIGWASEMLGRAKRANRTLFNLTKYVLIAAVLYWFVVH
jgi:beta-hydroxylase